jgi:hypothetical protein
MNEDYDDEHGSMREWRNELQATYEKGLSMDEIESLRYDEEYSNPYD